MTVAKERYEVVTDAEETSLRIPKPDASVIELVVSRVQEAIASGTLDAGQRMTERDMMERTGVSRTSVREALRHLHAVGLVESASGRSLIIPALDREAIMHIYEVREAIEPAAVRAFTERATDEQVQRYEDLLFGRGQERVAEGWAKSIAPDRLLLDVMGNPHFKRLMEPLYARIHPLRVLSATGERHVVAHDEMEAVIAAIRARDPLQAEEASRRHVQAARQAVLRAIDQLEKPDARVSDF